MRLATDRRFAHRIAVERPAKLRRRVSTHFEHAHTVNVSTTGALLEIESMRPVSVGETLSIAVAWDNAPLIGAGAFVPAKVVRADRTDDRKQRIALTFIQPEAVALAA